MEYETDDDFDEELSAISAAAADGPSSRRCGNPVVHQLAQSHHLTNQQLVFQQQLAMQHNYASAPLQTHHKRKSTTGDSSASAPLEDQRYDGPSFKRYRSPVASPVPSPRASPSRYPQQYASAPAYHVDKQLSPLRHNFKTRLNM